MATSSSSSSAPAAGSDIAGTCTDAAAMFTASRIPEAAATWHGMLRGLLARVTAALDDATDAPGAAATPESEAPALIRLQGTFAVHSMAENVRSSADWTWLTSHDRTFTVYPNAIQYHPIPHHEAGVEDDIAVAATALFNLGLCHHLQALVHGNRATSCYEKALKAYDASQQILEAAGFLGFVSSPPSSSAAPSKQQTLRLLIFALTNNAGHILDQLHAHDAAHQQLELLHLLVASTALSAAELLAGNGPYAPFLLTTALHPCHRGGRGAWPHPAPCA